MSAVKVFHSSNLWFIKSQVTSVNPGLKDCQEVVNVPSPRVLPGIPQKDCVMEANSNLTLTWCADG